MLKTLKALLGGQSERFDAPDASSDFTAGLPIGMSSSDFAGLRLDGRVRLKLSELAAYPDTLFQWESERDYHIAAVGHVELGQGAHLVRFYLENDTWLQANVEGKQVIEYKVFDFYRVSHLSNDEFDALLNPAEAQTSTLGVKRLTVASTADEGERVFDRVWGEPESEWSPPVQFEEQVMTQESVMTRQVVHHAMLYERAIKGAERMEYVLLSAEDDGEGGFMLVENLGVDVASIDIDAI
ncbi:DUF2491 family protein [Halomonas sp. PAMB 3264]|uniref:DUF2491 family protein n=1 Tax=Halomonas sp. PAMB 3264 TaxID=3075222 RepID=UPI00289A9422|nr:DUF2491 family protein [Halomonas sp. PAMB 3264]WNL41903.1 DUF2491 family protein [Halomonas sp. PAMB 3264]